MANCLTTIYKYKMLYPMKGWIAVFLSNSAQKLLKCGNTAGKRRNREPMKRDTHLDINEALCGTAVKIEEDYCLIRLNATEAMKVDAFGLIHGGFVFGAADYAAMLAVNHPNVVLGSAEVQFLKPLKVSETIFAEAKVVESKGRKKLVSVSVTVEDKEIFKGTITCFVLDRHVLDAA